MLPSTEDAATPFWSSDSRYLAFIADRKLKTISVSGEMPKPSPKMFIAMLAIGVTTGSFFLQTELRADLADRSLGWPGIASHSSQPKRICA